MAGCGHRDRRANVRREDGGLRPSFSVRAENAGEWAKGLNGSEEWFWHERILIPLHPGALVNYATPPRAQETKKICLSLKERGEQA